MRRTAIAMAAAAALHGAVWAYAVGRLSHEVSDRVADLRRDGWVVQAGPPQWGGWPAAASLTYGQVLVDGTAAGAPVTWSADSASLALRAAQPDTLFIAAGGNQAWRLGRAAPVPVAAEAFELALTQAGASLAARGIVLRLPDGPVTVGAAQLHGAGQSLGGTLTAVGVPSLSVADVSIQEAALTQPIPVADSPAAAAAAWHKAGGTVRLSGITLQAGGLGVAAAGTGRLDDALQPVLDLTAQVRGHRAALDALVKAGAVSPSGAVAAKAVLGLLAGRQPDAPATVPLRVADGVLTAAGFPLLRLPGLDWTAAAAR